MLRAATICLTLMATLLGALGCQGAPQRSLPTVRAAAVRVGEEADGPWKPEARYEEIGGPWRVVDGTFASEAPVQRASRPARAVDPFQAPARAAVRPVARTPKPPKLAVMRRRARRDARPVGKKTGKSTEQLAREHFLDYPTRIVAQKITLYLPPAFAHEARLTGAAVSSPQAGRRIARGGARLLVRELTLEADRITLRVRQDGRNDLQIMARGQVGFVAEVRANILREEGLRSLLITNDQVVPIR